MRKSIAIAACLLALYPTQAGRIFVSTKYAVIPYPAVVPPFTVAGWVKIYAKANNLTSFHMAGTTDNYHILGWAGGGSPNWWIATREYSLAFTAYSVATGTVNTNQWYHIAGVWSAVDRRVIYVNGVPLGTNTVSRNPGVSKFAFGTRVEGAIPAATPEYMNGEMAHCAVWTDALTDAEISQMAGGGNPSLAVSPIKIRPNKLNVYAPLDGALTLYERNESGSVFALSNSPASVSSFTLVR